MAIELNPELIALQEAADAAGRRVSETPNDGEARAAWFAASAAVQAAVTDHAAVSNWNRFELEKALRTHVRHPELRD
ncbi:MULTISPECIES: hypothetical protein [Streptomyces diastaticus group]|uniref:hypothetical protein n=1 Tax=Streptomyces diastaticus group TaxID=2849069 RepID=UPI0013C62E74|nr:hypothetical protein [Streptomyces rutgersensis]GFH67489.1 hypothetical protein Srut_40030 [Streptomyces rutgersensis]